MHDLPYIFAQGLTTVREETRVELARWSSGNALLVGVLLSAAGLYAVAWMYRREGRGSLSRRMRWSLTVCRLAVLLLLGVIGLEPVLTRYIHRRLDASTLLLLDDSASMTLADRYRAADLATRVEKVVGNLPSDGVPRMTVAEALVKKDESALVKALAQRNRVKTFTFADNAIPRSLQLTPDNPAAVASATGEGGDAQPWTPKLAGDGPATNFGQAVRTAVDSLGGAPVAGVVVITDGGFNTGEDPIDVARFLKQRGIPLYAVGVGDPAEPVNVRVAEVLGPRAAFKNDPFTVTVRLQTEGAAGRTIKVDLIEKSGGSDTPDEVAESRTITVGPSGVVPPLMFERQVAAPGAITYLARTQPLDDELVRSDNAREILPAVQILDDKMRVLLVAGSASYDYRFLTRMLERDKTVDVSCWLQSADIAAVRDGTTVIKELPTQQEDLFKYDAVLLLDVNPQELDPTWGSLLAMFVADHGGGVLYEAGRKFSEKFFRSPATTSLVEILPVVPDPDAEILLNELGQYQTRSWPIQFSDEALNDPILRMSEDPTENRAVWSILDGIYWHFPVRREKPVATALMRHTNPRMANAFGEHVVFATQFVGAGRTAFLGFDTTHRWRRFDEKLFNRFWIQTLRYLVEGKLMGGRARGTITTPKQQYDLGESVVITARALDERFNPLQLPALEMKAIAGAKGTSGGEGEPSQQSVTPVSLAPVPGREGFYQGRFVPRKTGAYHLRMELATAGTGPAVVEREILVTQPDIELRDPAMQRSRLQQLVAEAGEGQYCDADEAIALAALIPDRSRTPPPIRERPRPLWDNRYVLMALVGLLTIEWILRKKAKLL